MSLERWLFGSCVYPAYHFFKGDRVNARVAEYEASQWFTPKELRVLQECKLRELMGHAARHVPHYRQLIDESLARKCSTHDLGRLPPLTKAVIRQSPEMLRAENARHADLEANSTSGSTGRAFVFFHGQALLGLQEGDCGAQQALGRHRAR